VAPAPVDWLNKDDKSALTRELRNARGHSSTGERDLLRARRYPRYSVRAISGCPRAEKNTIREPPIKSRSTRAHSLSLSLSLSVAGVLIALGARAYARQHMAVSHENRQ